MLISSPDGDFPAVLLIFLPNFAEITEKRFFSSMKFIRTEPHRKTARGLWKTPPQSVFFPQISAPEPLAAKIFTGKNTACQQLPAKGKLRWKARWKTKKFRTHPINTQFYIKTAVSTAKYTQIPTVA